MSGRWGRWTSLTGAVFAVLIAVGVFAGSETPEPSAGPVKVYAYYAAHISSIETSAILFAISVLFIVIWGAVLARYLRDSGGSRGAEVLVVPGAVLFAVGALTIASIEYGTAHNLHYLSAETARTLNILTDIMFLPLIAGGFFFALGSGIAVVRGAALPKWLGWAAIVIGIAAIVPPASFPALLAFAIWSLIVSTIVFVRLGSSEETAAPAPAPAT
jgi:hypothetical protein